MLWRQGASRYTRAGLSRRAGPVIAAATVCLGWGLAAALVAAPVAAEQAVERAHFSDRLGTLPVEVSLAHNGVSTIDTGVLGQIYWSRTGTAGFGAYIRATGPPQAGGTLSSYVDPAFVRVNATLLNAPSEVADAYGRQMADEVLLRFLRVEAAVALLVAAAAAAVRRRSGPWRPRRLYAGGALLAALLVSAGAAAALFARWEGTTAVGQRYPLPAVPGLSFSTPQTREVAVQVQPFIEKNTERIREEARRYQDTAEASLRSELPAHTEGLLPEEGERVVVAEADPQGNWVGTRVRRLLYPMLVELLGQDAVVLRTISGDITSNGTLAEEGYVEAEAGASGEIPTVAVPGDHDSDATTEQLEDHGVTVPDLETVTVGELEVAGADDPEFKTLFGGMVTNESGVTEIETGERLREAVEGDSASIVLLHQPEAALAYLGVDPAQLQATEGHLTRPWDDGIPDLPPGTVAIGHLHDDDGPWVIWNTDTEAVTWTVVDQLGTSGGVEEHPTFNRFSTPYSTPLKDITVRLVYVDEATGLQTGYATIEVDVRGRARVIDRVDVGLPLDGTPVAGERPGADRLADAGGDIEDHDVRAGTHGRGGSAGAGS